MMISLELARRLRAAGMRWQPGDGDQFVVPDRELDDVVFTVSEMTVEVRDIPSGRLIAFNGTVEWALDAVLQHEVVWLPRESQLRELLGEAFVRLERDGDGVRCHADVAGQARAFAAADAADAYGLALLERLRHDADHLLEG
jgi:hypothetical protein